LQQKTEDLGVRAFDFLADLARRGSLETLGAHGQHQQALKWLMMQSARQLQMPSRRFRGLGAVVVSQVTHDLDEKRKYGKLSIMMPVW
jgi:hypothetical protein